MYIACTQIILRLLSLHFYFNNIIMPSSKIRVDIISLHKMGGYFNHQVCMLSCIATTTSQGMCRISIRNDLISVYLK